MYQREWCFIFILYVRSESRRSETPVWKLGDGRQLTLGRGWGCLEEKRSMKTYMR